MDELETLRKLAGIGEFKGYQPYGIPTVSMAEKREYEKTNHIKPGSPEWFKLYFARTQLTGETPF